VARIFAAFEVPAAPADGQARTLAAAAPLLAARAAAHRTLRRQVAWALTLALLPLPVIVFANVKLLTAAYHFLAPRLPPLLSLYLVGCVAAGVALLLALAYLAVPLVARRQSLTSSTSSFATPLSLTEEIHVRA
jgi:hypothetical protein